MASNCKQTKQIKSTEEGNFKMRTSFSWDSAFFTSDGVLDAEELLNMIGGNDQFESLETKLFEEIEASNQKPKMSPGKPDSPPKKSIAPVSTQKAAPIKTSTTKPAPLSGDFGGKNVKSPNTTARKNTVKSATNSPSKTPSGISTKNKTSLINTTRLAKTSPSSPVTQRSSSSPSSPTVNQRSKRGSSVPGRSVINKEKSSSPISSLKNKPTPVSCNSLSPLGLSRSPQLSGQRSSSLTKTGSPIGTNVSPQRITISPKKQSKPVAISPEILDLKGKLNALRMEIQRLSAENN